MTSTKSNTYETVSTRSPIQEPQHGIKHQMTTPPKPTSPSDGKDNDADEDAHAFILQELSELNLFLPSPNWRQKDGQWIPVLDRAVHSNRERLRLRLEGDGWDFVAGKYAEEEDSGSASKESMDEELDIVLIMHAPEAGRN
ncbi:uncharacterized protein EI97DRAFT_437870 [Westerdykella ornata]|uniref:Uncharacterized protein n=1 Tax=Westerdykella ornata TaxID=318751 RepID=A0A6A6J4E1_WESOR|nr:uncharacterized protein EI97DRAFT_437870 [Westerdykella ornata]KAF2271440.1 hypothetical protein EI97DRAFT_437870 [Westerdykella ornata]